MIVDALYARIVWICVVFVMTVNAGLFAFTNRKGPPNFLGFTIPRFVCVWFGVYILFFLMWGLAGSIRTPLSYKFNNTMMALALCTVGSPVRLVIEQFFQALASFNTTDKKRNTHGRIEIIIAAYCVVSLTCAISLQFFDDPISLIRISSIPLWFFVLEASYFTFIGISQVVRLFSLLADNHIDNTHMVNRIVEKKKQAVLFQRVVLSTVVLIVVGELVLLFPAAVDVFGFLAAFCVLMVSLAPLVLQLRHVCTSKRVKSSSFRPGKSGIKRQDTSCTLSTNSSAGLRVGPDELKFKTGQFAFSRDQVVVGFRIHTE